MTWQAIAYSGFRGTLRQRSANLVNVVGYVVVPLGVVLAARLSAAEVSPSALIGWIGLLNIVVGLGQTARLIVTLEGAWIEGLVGRLHQLLGYSAPRVPGSVAQGLMMTLGPLVAQRGGYSIAASYLLAGLAFAQLGAAALQSFSTVLLPRVSSMHSRGDHIGVRKVTESFIQVMVIFVAVFVPFSLGSTTSLLSLWLGDLFLPSVAATRIVILAVPFYVLYSVLTSVTDALILRPVSTYAAILGLSGMLLGFLFADASSSTQLAVVFLVGQIIAGLIVAITVIAVVRPRLWPRQVVLQVFFGGAGGAAVFGAESFLGSGATHLATTAALGIIMVIVLVMLSPAESGVRSQFSALIGIHRV
jgi:O-antigen/teichoic acid export membrane protein